MITEQILSRYPTPFYLYDEKGIRSACKDINSAFSWNNGFKEYFAVKATPNPNIVKIVTDEGCGVDVSSLAELVIAERLGLRGENIILTSNDTPIEEFKKAKELGAIINLDDIQHLEHLSLNDFLPEIISFRYNPGKLRSGNSIIGEPEESKFGVTKEQLFIGYKRARELGINRFGIHTMLASNELNIDYFVETASMLFDLVLEISAELKIKFETINLGGGIGIAYKPGEKPADLGSLGKRICEVYRKKIEPTSLHPIKLSMECGRVITGPSGILVTRVRHIKSTYRKYIGVDASAADLLRPAMYGAYHRVSVFGKSGGPTEDCDVVGSLCENNDKFVVSREIPKVEVGDIILIHDVGAHGHAMGYNYNGKLRCAEVLLRSNGDTQLIRRAETIDDYFDTVVWSVA